MDDRVRRVVATADDGIQRGVLIHMPVDDIFRAMLLDAGWPADSVCTTVSFDVIGEEGGTRMSDSEHQDMIDLDLPENDLSPVPMFQDSMGTWRRWPEQLLYGKRLGRDAVFPEEGDLK